MIHKATQQLNIGPYFIDAERKVRVLSPKDARGRFTGSAAALAGISAPKSSPRVMSLNGEWAFKWSPNPASRPVDFYQDDFSFADWGKIKVPSIWQVEGHGVPIYVTARYPFPSTGMRAPQNPNEVGSYRREFELPWSLEDGHSVFLHFEGFSS